MLSQLVKHRIKGIEKMNSNQSPKRAMVASLLYVEASLVFALGAWLAVLGFTHEEKEMAPLLGVIVFAVLDVALDVVLDVAFDVAFDVALCFFDSQLLPSFGALANSALK